MGAHICAPHHPIASAWHMHWKGRTGMEHEGARSATLGANTQAETLRCTICERRLSTSIHFMEETGDVPEPRLSWVLCDECNSAVRQQLDQSPLRTPVRLRVAIGLVATERSPAARREHFGELSDSQWATLFFWLFPITMLVHLAIIVAVAGWFK